MVEEPVSEVQREMVIGNKEDRHANLAYKKFQFSTEGPWGYVGAALNHLAVRLSIQQVADHAWIQPVNDLMRGVKNLVDQINGNNLVELGGCGWYAPSYVLQRFADLPENQCLAALRRYVGMDHAKIYDKPTYLLTALWNEMNDPKYYSFVSDDEHSPHTRDFSRELGEGSRFTVHLTSPKTTTLKISNFTEKYHTEKYHTEKYHTNI